MLISRTTLVSQLVPPLDAQLAHDLVDEFVSQEKRFIQGDWEPSQLDGGQFCEVLARIVYHRDSGNLNAGQQFAHCAAYVENDQVPHAINPRQDAIHLVKVLKTIYKFRSQRGAVHLSPNYKPNHMDSKIVVDMVRWAFAESLRIFWNGDREQVAKAIRELLQFDVPAIGRFEDVLMVQRTDLSAGEEVLVLLHYAGETGFSRKELGKYVMHDAPRVTEALKALASPASRQVILLTSGRYRLTDLGSKYLRERLSEKLLLG
jgi:hypothetical protein